ncbi:MAG: class I SAM-dependent methyltransferase [Acidobacteriota bacterium]
MNRDVERFLDTLPIGDSRALEVSGWAHEPRPWKSYRSTTYPEFDLCTREPIEPSAEVVICEQVLEHLPDPVQATRNLFASLEPGGHAIVSVPFMIRIHKEPGDYWRFSADGLRALLENAGFEVLESKTWGNRLAALANMWFWFPYIPLLCPLLNNPKIPLVVWAFARRPETAQSQAQP